MTKLPSGSKLVDLVTFFVQLMLFAVVIDFVTAQSASSLSSYINGSNPSTVLVGLSTTRHRRRSYFGGYGGDSDTDSDSVDQTPLTSKRFEGK